MGKQINNKIKSKTGKHRKNNNFTVPFDQLCLDSIPEMIYNAILLIIKIFDNLWNGKVTCIMIVC